MESRGSHGWLGLALVCSSVISCPWFLGFFCSLLLLPTVTFSPAYTLLCFACFLAIWVIEGCFSSKAKSARCRHHPCKEQAAFVP